jgi:hypothetical protein
MIFSGTGPSFSTEGYIFFSCLIDIQTNEERYNFPFMSLPLCERLALVSVVWLLLIVFSFLCCGLCVCVILFFVVFVLCLEPNADCVSRFSILGCVLCLEPNADCVSRFSILGCVLCLEPNADCVSRFSILGCPLRLSLTYIICMLLLWTRSTIYRNYCIQSVSVKEITNFYISYSLILIPLQHT